MRPQAPARTGPSGGDATGKPPPGRFSEARRGLIRYLYWLFRNAPAPVSRLHLAGLCGLLRLLGHVPGNPVRRSCGSVARLARRRGISHRPRVIYREFVGQIHLAAGGYLAAMRDGPRAIPEWTSVPGEVTERIRGLLGSGTGVLLSVPHNVGGILCAAALARHFPVLVLARNSTSARRDRMMLELLERLGVEGYLTRSVNVGGLYRACVRALRGGTVVVATLDNIDPGRRSRLRIPMFGREVDLPSWGARIAARAGAPVVPGWVGLAEGKFRVRLGASIFAAPAEAVVRHYMAYFEDCILEDPASWLFLGHKRWGATLREAAERR